MASLTSGSGVADTLRQNQTNKQTITKHTQKLLMKDPSETVLTLLMYVYLEWAGPSFSRVFPFILWSTP
jgi:hypothetical protein